MTGWLGVDAIEKMLALAPEQKSLLRTRQECIGQRALDMAICTNNLLAVEFLLEQCRKCGILEEMMLEGDSSGDTVMHNVCCTGNTCNIYFIHMPISSMFDQCMESNSEC